MKRSIRHQIVIVFVVLIVSILFLIFFVNSKFLGQYYIMNKESEFIDTYAFLNRAAREGQVTDADVVKRLNRQANSANIAVLAVKSDGMVIYSTVKDDDPLYIHLFSYIFEKNRNVGKILKSTYNYSLYTTLSFDGATEYMEMYGDLDDGSIFMMRSPIESLRESAKLANKFLIYMGIIATVLGGVFVWLFSYRIAKPVKELATLSKKMAALDFNARYTGSGENEIGVLGNNFNIMSERLKKTISELKRANNALKKDIEQKEKAENVRNEFLGNVSHELKTPIALIQGYAEGLKEGVSEDPDSRTYYCDVIIEEAAKMNRMVRNLLALNQLEFGDDAPEFERIDIVALIKGVISSCELLVRQAGAYVDFVADGAVYVWADEFKTELVVRNYFTNAVYHVKNEKRIEIRVILKGDVVRVTVFNSGDPIPESDIKKLWDKFYKVDKSHTNGYGGTGIGLSIVKAVMESFHQAYGVRNFENGVQFWFELDAKKS